MPPRYISFFSSFLPDCLFLLSFVYVALSFVPVYFFLSFIPVKKILSCISLTSLSPFFLSYRYISFYLCTGKFLLFFLTGIFLTSPPSSKNRLFRIAIMSCACLLMNMAATVSMAIVLDEWSVSSNLWLRCTIFEGIVLSVFLAGIFHSVILPGIFLSIVLTGIFVSFEETMTRDWAAYGLHKGSRLRVKGLWG